MKKILLGFIAIGLLTFVGCEKEEDETTETSSEDSLIEYGEGATDIDGNTYKSVIIGEQEWMAENLRTSKYSDGTAIPNVTDSTQWENLTTGAWCNYNNSSTNDASYGKLYNWYAVETGKLCPTGWHVPTDSEWYVLIHYLTANGDSSTEGKALKSTSGWNNGGNGTDDYGWNGLPGGEGYAWNTSFGRIGNYGSWWSSSQGSGAWYDEDAWNVDLHDDWNGVSIDDDLNVKHGYSVRCLRD
jgi:uncharacterized protein (TIGR02145 family)